MVRGRSPLSAISPSMLHVTAVFFYSDRISIVTVVVFVDTRRTHGILQDTKRTYTFNLSVPLSVSLSVCLSLSVSFSLPPSFPLSLILFYSLSSFFSLSSLSFPLSYQTYTPACVCTQAHTHTHTHTRARARARAHALTHTQTQTHRHRHRHRHGQADRQRTQRCSDESYGLIITFNRDSKAYHLQHLSPYYFLNCWSNPRILIQQQKIIDSFLSYIAVPSPIDAPEIEDLAMMVEGRAVQFIEEGASVTLTCSLDQGNPPRTATFFDHSRSELVPRVTAEGDAMQIEHVIDGVQCQDSGLIRCEAEGATVNKSALMLVQCQRGFKILTNAPK